MKITNIYFEKPGIKAPYLKSKSLLYWLASHIKIKVWVLWGGPKWNLLLIKDEGNNQKIRSTKDSIELAKEDILEASSERKNAS